MDGDNPGLKNAEGPQKTIVVGDFDPELLLETFITKLSTDPKSLKDSKSKVAVRATEHIPRETLHNPSPPAVLRSPKTEPIPSNNDSSHPGLTRVCQICLRTDIESENIVDSTLKDFYYELMHYDFQLYHCPRLQFCPVCEHTLRKLYNFRQKCRRAHILLKAWSTHTGKTSLESLQATLPESSIGFWTDASANNIYTFVSSDTAEIKKLKEEEEEYSYTENIEYYNNSDMEEYVETEEVSPETESLQITYLPETSDEKHLIENVNHQNVNLPVQGKLKKEKHQTNNPSAKIMDKYDKYIDMLKKTTKVEDTKAEEMMKAEEYSDSENIEIYMDNTDMEEYDQTQYADLPEKSDQNAYLPETSDGNVHFTDTDNKNGNLLDKNNKENKRLEKYDKFFNTLIKDKKLQNTRKKIQHKTYKLGSCKKKDEKFAKHVIGVILDRIDQGMFSDIVDRGTTITKENFLEMLEKTDLRCLSVETTKMRWFITTLLQRFNPIYESMFNIEHLDTQEQMEADFQRQKNSKQYLEAKHKCDICSRIFDTWGKKSYHMQWHDAEKPIGCDICGMRFDSHTALQSHMHYNHKLTYRCKKCDYVTNSTKAMKGHYDSHQPSGAKEMRCSHCDKVFTNVNWLRNHISQKHRPREYWCTICGGNFVREWGLQQHITVKHGDVSEELQVPPTEQCTKCSVAFHRKEALENHIKILHVKYDETFIDKCCEAFDDEEELKAHKLQAHKTVRPRNGPKYMPVRYKACRVCKEVHHSRRLYFHHMIKHPDVPYVIEGYISRLCDLCGKGYKSQHEYQDHMNIHYGVKPYECSVCGASFTSRVGANTHLQRHGPRNYRCEHCGKRFFTSTARASHVRIHINDRRYRCETCDKGFLHAASLRHHIDGVHNKIRRVKKIKAKSTNRTTTLKNQLQYDSSCSQDDDLTIMRDGNDELENQASDRDESMKEDHDELENQDHDRDELGKEEDYESENQVFDRDESENQVFDQDESENQVFDHDESVKNDTELENQVLYSDECETQGFGEDVVYLVLEDHANEEIVEWDYTE